MTITSTVSRVDALGNSSATTFSFSPAVITQASDLSVWLVDNLGNQSLLSQGLGPAQYAIVTPMTYPGTGSISYPGSGGTVLPTGWKLVMKQRAPLLQQFAPQNQGPYLAATFMAAFDYAILTIQAHEEQLARAILAPETDPATFLHIPSAAARANLLLGFDGSGNPAAVGFAAGSVPVSSAMQPVVAAATVAAALALLIVGLPTTLPATSGQLWNNSGVLSIS